MTSSFFTAFVLAAAGISTLLLPGLIWQVVLRSSYADLFERLADALGLSLALLGLLALGGFIFRGLLPSTLPAQVMALVVLLAAMLGLRLERNRRMNSRIPSPVNEDDAGQEAGSWKAYDGVSREEPDPVGLLRSRFNTRPVRRVAVAIRRPASPGSILLGLLGLALLIFWRFYQVRDLALPAWVDPLHHVLIVRLLLENGGVPENFAPYMPVPFYYHFGFHVAAAVFGYLSGVDLASAVLVVGQLLNVGVVLAVYRLGMAFWDDRRRAGIAALLVGFVSQMPAYYVTWGRFTLLAGLVLLPLAMAVAVEIVRLGGDLERGARLAVLSAGLVVSHYFAALLFALFLAVLLGYALYLSLRTNKPVLRRYILPAVAGALAGAVLTAPWIYRVWISARAFTGLTTVSPSHPLYTVYFNNYLPYLWYLLGPARNYLLLALGLFGLALAGPRPRTRVLSIWTLTLVILSLPWGPKLAPFRPDHAVIVMFLPVNLLAADGLITALERLKGNCSAMLARLAAIAAVLALVIWGVAQTRQIINPQTIIARPADLEAIRWVDANLPPDARFLINVAPWQNGMYRGLDGGWWLLPLTGRQTLVPPTMYLLGDPAYVSQINAWAEQAARLNGCTPEFWDLVRAARLTHVYLGPNGGALKPADLEGCANLEVVYARDGVTIYEIQTPGEDLPAFGAD